MDLWHEIGRQLRRPSGLPGRLVGHFMRVVNCRANALAIAALEIKPTDTILELGFGPGHAIHVMARLAPYGTIHGVDHSHIMFGQARGRNLSFIRSGHVVLHECGFDELPLPDASIDKILAVNVGYFWTQAGTTLQEARRVLRSSGTMAIYVTDAAIMQQWKFAGPESHQLFSVDGVRNLLQRGGFDQSLVDVKSVHAGPGIPGFVATARKRDADAQSVRTRELATQVTLGDPK